MSKEFKDFDKKYKHLMGTGLKHVINVCGLPDDVHVDIVSWPYSHQFTEAYDHSEVRYACYEAKTALEWQKFRVSLKGLSTREKLYCLMWYWGVNITPGPGAHVSKLDWQCEVIRVNNYLGALKRGGQLDQHLRVVK